MRIKSAAERERAHKTATAHKIALATIKKNVKNGEQKTKKKLPGICYVYVNVIILYCFPSPFAIEWDIIRVGERTAKRQQRADDGEYVLHVQTN